MKKLFFLMVITTISTSGFAQIGVQAGATFASVKSEDKTSGGQDLTSDSKVGFTVGLYTNVSLSDNFVFRPGLNYTQKGGKIDETSSGITVKSKATYNYLELPLNIIYKAPGGFFAGLGPVLSYGIGGKEKYSISGTGVPSQSGDDKVKFGSDKNSDSYKAFEFSGNLLAGYQLGNGIFFMVNYNMGFSNISLDPSNESLKNRYFGIRIGKTFSAGKQ